MANNLSDESCILYLDQNVIRFVTNFKEGNPGIQLRKIINIGVETGALTCPFSDEHFWEASAIPGEAKRRAQLEWLAVVSMGACFRSRESLVALQLIKLVRRNSECVENFLCKVDVAENEEVIESMGKVCAKRKKDAEEYFSNYNQRRATGRILRSIPNEVMHAQQIDVFYEGIADCIAHHIVKMGEYDDTTRKLFDNRPFGSRVLDELLATYKVKPDELEIILKRVIETRGHCAPLIHIQSKLYESWMLEQKKLKMTDIYDLYRISTALPYADILVVDREQRRHLFASGLTAMYDAKIYSLEQCLLEPLCEEIADRIKRRLVSLIKLSNLK